MLLRTFVAFFLRTKGCYNLTGFKSRKEVKSRVRLNTYD